MSKSPIIISGMHRSGTSLVANYLLSCGVFLGENLMGAGKGNVRGHFENWLFVDFHDKVLRENNEGVYYFSEPHIEISASHEQEARALINRCKNEMLWGWKDPRTVLFLKFWAAVYPEAKYVFVFRKQNKVIDSLFIRDNSFRNILLGHFIWHIQRL